MRYNPALDGLLPFGWIGVQLFFVLSGFLITRILVETRSLPAGAYFKRFYWRRTLRIFPLYYAFLAVAAVVFAVSGSPEGFDQDWQYLVTYTHNLARLQSGDVHTFVHFWSLAVEEQFYLVWPVLIFLLSPSALRKTALAILVAVPLLRWLAGDMADSADGVTAHYAERVVYSLPFSHFDAFAIGALVATCPLQWIRNRRSALLGGLAIIGAVGCVHVVILHLQGGVFWPHFGYPHYLGPNAQYVWGFTLLNIVAGLAVLCCRDGNAMGSWLEHRSLVYVGKISYGVYVFHVPIIELVSRWLPIDSGLLGRVASMVACCVLTLLIAVLSFELFEKPIMRWKGK